MKARIEKDGNIIIIVGTAAEKIERGQLVYFDKKVGGFRKWKR